MKVARNPTSTRRPVFVVSWDPRLPSVSAITKKHWRIMTQDPLMEEMFPEPPLNAYRRQKNIGYLVIRAKAYPNIVHPKRKIRGMTKCKTNCPECPYNKVSGYQVNCCLPSMRSVFLGVIDPKPNLNCENESFLEKKLFFMILLTKPISLLRNA